MYKTFKIPKGNGKFRIIEEPCPELKEAQHKILAESLNRIRLFPHSHAFVPGRNIVSAAEPHVGKEFVACCDIVDFFPSIKASMLTTLVPATIEYIDTVTYDFGDGKGERLPQGAPTSPMLSNLYLNGFDSYISINAETLGCSYTRYADDLIFSGDSRSKMKTLIQMSKETLYEVFRLEVHPKKTKIMHRSQRQIVCGVVVNEKLNVNRQYRKNLRAEIFKQRGGKSINRRTKGKQAFVKMVRGEV